MGIWLKPKNPPVKEGSRGAPVARLELATRGLTVRCSNQLSYTGKIISITAGKFTEIFIFK